MSNRNSISERGTGQVPGWSRKKALLTLLLLVPAVLVFTAADRSADAIPCRALEIEVDQIDGMYFVDAPTLHHLVTERFNLIDQPMATLPLGDLHDAIMAQHGVADCNIEPTLGGALRITVGQQRPIARIWSGDTVQYMDDKGRSLPLSPRYTADVPIVHAPDFASATAARTLINHMDNVPFWNDFIDQVEVDADGAISFRPRIADVRVELGIPDTSASRLDDQLERLFTFYKELIQRGDLRQYRTISLQYDGQLVAAK